MTKTQAAELQTKWIQQGDPPPLCEHWIQELTSSDLDDQGHVLNTYHCRQCGELFVHRLKGNSLPNSSLMESEYFNEL
jgi:hypothetical protein